jgi:lipoate-protein ligase A
MYARLIIHGARAPRENMAIDEALLLSCEAGGEGFPALRFYWWKKATLSLGAKEDLAGAADTEACRRHGVEIVRRPTGGRSVLHYSELTYSIVGPLGKSPYTGSVLESYHRIALAMKDGFTRLGAELELTAGTRRSAKGRSPCFAAPSRYELAFEGRKVVGSAQRRLRRSALQHGSILLNSDIDVMAVATGAGEAQKAVLQSAMIGLNEILNRSLSREEIIAALVLSLGSALEWNLRESDINGREKEMVDQLLARGCAQVETVNANTD